MNSCPDSNWYIRRLLTWSIVVLGLAMASIACSNSGADEPTAVEQTGYAEIIGSPLRPFSRPDTAIATTAPVIVAETFDGERLRLGDDDTARIFAFLAHWCPHCQAELPALVDWLSTVTMPEGVEIVAVSTAVNSDADNYPPSEWFEREGYNATLIRDNDDGTLANGFGLIGFPYWVSIGADGNVIERITGAVNQAKFEQMLAQAADSVNR